ncbi:MAG: hypothetical protein H0T84_08625 [Tatlockia sp.]|nr:hypothetical protein [Tatlockia sp.]
MLKKFIPTFLIATLWIILHSNVVLAVEPHIVPTNDCPQGQTCCPIEIYCSYKKGCGDSDKWMVSAYRLSPFEGVRQFNISRIVANSYTDQKSFFLNCEYEGITLTDSYFKLIGNWNYSDFKDTKAECSTNNPLDCTGIKNLNIKSELKMLNFIQIKHMLSN